MDLLFLFKIYLFVGTIAYIAFIFWLFRKPGMLSVWDRRKKPKAMEPKKADISEND